MGDAWAGRREEIKEEGRGRKKLKEKKKKRWGGANFKYSMRRAD